MAAFGFEKHSPTGQQTTLFALPKKVKGKKSRSLLKSFLKRVVKNLKLSWTEIREAKKEGVGTEKMKDDSEGWFCWYM